MARLLKAEMQKQLEHIRDWSEAGYIDQLTESSVREMVRTFHSLAVLGLGIDLPVRVSLRKLPAPAKRGNRKRRAKK
jgi:hypothetical protein